MVIDLKRYIDLRLLFDDRCFIDLRWSCSGWGGSLSWWSNRYASANSGKQLDNRRIDEVVNDVAFSVTIIENRLTKTRLKTAWLKLMKTNDSLMTTELLLTNSLTTAWWHLNYGFGDVFWRYISVIRTNAGTTSGGSGRGATPRKCDLHLYIFLGGKKLGNLRLLHPSLATMNHRQWIEPYQTRNLA